MAKRIVDELAIADAILSLQMAKVEQIESATGTTGKYRAALPAGLRAEIDAALIRHSERPRRGNLR